MSQIDFDQQPPLGTVVMLDSQSYRLVAAEPYTRTDGAASAVLTWLSECPTCGDEFTVQSGLRTKTINRRCQVHRRIGAPIGKRGKPVTVRIILPASPPEISK